MDVETLTLNMSLGIKNAKFVPGKTCIIFDEIQDCPNARSSLKFFKQDGRYDVICTGSLLGVNGYKTKEDDAEEQNASIPVGFEDIVQMYPMDFEEWLWANGIEQQHIDYLRRCLEQETPVNEAFHQRFRQLLLRYVVVGGMPEAVATFFKTNNMGDVLQVQRGIVDSYKSDMLKYARQEDKARIRECFDSIPVQLAKDNKKFQYSVIRKGARSSEYQGSLLYVIPKNHYQPLFSDYLLTYAEYGSCPLCDLLEGICESYDKEHPEETADSLMSLCLHLLQRCKIPYAFDEYVSDSDWEVREMTDEEYEQLKKEAEGKPSGKVGGIVFRQPSHGLVTAADIKPMTKAEREKMKKQMKETAKKMFESFNKK